MTDARAFPFLAYDPDEVGDRGALLAPPYDVINDAERAELAAESPYQSVLLELPEGGNDDAAGALLRDWVQRGIVAGDIGLAVIQQRYVGPDGIRRTRLGVECEIKLHDFADRKVLPHEQTFEGPRIQRLELMHATGANISPVFVVYHDPERALTDVVSSVTDEEPDFTATDHDGTQTAVWIVTDPAICEDISAAIEPHTLLIADGHHRYTAALAYRDQAVARGRHLVSAGGSEHDGPPHTPSSGIDGVLAVVCNSADPGMMVFPTHRIVHGANARDLTEFVVGSGAFDVTEHDDVPAAMAALDALDAPGFVVYLAGKAHLYATNDPVDLELASPGTSDAYRSLDVTALHSLVIDGGAILGQNADKVTYTRSLDEAIEIVDGGEDRIGFLMRHVDVAQIHAVAAAGELLPQKSTYFYPKVPTGVLFRPVEPLV